MSRIAIVAKDRKSALAYEAIGWSPHVVSFCYGDKSVPILDIDQYKIVVLDPEGLALSAHDILTTWNEKTKKRARVLVISNSSAEKDRKSLLAAGAAMHIPKPYTPTQIHDAIKKLNS